MNVEFISVENLQNVQSHSMAHISSSRASQLVTESTKISKLSEENIQSVTKTTQKTLKKPKVQQRFSCPICKVPFQNKKLYELHKKIHKNNGKYKCDECQQSFHNIDQLSNHACKQEGKSRGQERYQCNICQVCFVDFSDLDSHVRLHFDSDIRYKCNICNTSVFDINHLVKHTSAAHINTSNIKLNCCVCGNFFDSISEFVKHDQNHKRESGALNCTECGKTCSSLTTLKSHKKTHTMPRTQPYSCPKCSLRFSRSEDLHHHIRIHDGKSIYCCALCDRMFAHSKNLTNHIQKGHSSCFTVDELDIIDFVVEAEVAAQVDKRKKDEQFSDHNVLVDGDVFKFNVRELVTKYVEKETLSLATTLPLQSIQPSSFIGTNVNRKFINSFRKYKCPLCELIFVKAKTLEIHCKRNHHGNYTLEQLKDIQKTVDQNNCQLGPRAILNCRLNIANEHECPSCNHKFGSRQELISHLKSDHNGDEPYKCVECLETFATSNLLADHVLNHPDKRHVCKFCGLSFMNLYSLGKHTKRHEGKIGYLVSLFFKSSMTL